MYLSEFKWLFCPWDIWQQQHQVGWSRETPVFEICRLFAWGVAKQAKLPHYTSTWETWNSECTSWIPGCDLIWLADDYQNSRRGQQRAEACVCALFASREWNNSTFACQMNACIYTVETSDLISNTYTGRATVSTGSIFNMITWESEGYTLCLGGRLLPTQVMSLEAVNVDTNRLWRAGGEGKSQTWVLETFGQRY